MMVTTNIIITASPSICVPTPKSMLPFCHHVIEWTTGFTTSWCSAPAISPLPNAARPSDLPVASLTRSNHWTPAMHASTNDVPTAAMPISAPFFGMRLPKKRIKKNEAAGSEGMIQAASSIVRSALQLVDFVEARAAQVPIDQQDDGKADADLGGRDGDHEQREHLPGDRLVVGGEGNEVDVHRVEHQLDAHQDQHPVAAREYAVDPGAEQERAEDEELVQIHVARPLSLAAPAQRHRRGRRAATWRRLRMAPRTYGRSSSRRSRCSPAPRERR